MKLLEKIVRSIFSQPKPKELSDKCEVFLYPETAEKLKRIEKILERFEKQNENPYKKGTLVALFHFNLFQFIYFSYFK